MVARHRQNVRNASGSAGLESNPKTIPVSTLSSHFRGAKMRALPQDAMSYSGNSSQSTTTLTMRQSPSYVGEVIHSPSILDNHIGQPILRTVHEDYAVMIPEAYGLTWRDDFFKDDEEDGAVIAVFDFDYTSMQSYGTQVGWCLFGCTVCWQPLFVTALLSLVPCCIHKNVRWWAESHHVSIQRDGLVMVQESHRRCWGCFCPSEERIRRIPYHQIQDCSVQEANGHTCFIIVNVLHTVDIQTTTTRSSAHDLCPDGFKIVGLCNPRAFQRLLMAMKHNHSVQTQAMTRAASVPLPRAYPTTTETAPATTTTTAVCIDAIMAQNYNDNDNNHPTEVTTLLREIRDELREHNQLYQAVQENQRVINQNIANHYIQQDNEGQSHPEASVVLSQDDDRTELSYPTVSTLTFNPNN